MGRIIGGANCFVGRAICCCALLAVPACSSNNNPSDTHSSGDGWTGVLFRDGQVDALRDGSGGDSRFDAAPAEDCRDGLRNGDEEAVDCGGRCQPCADSEADLYLDPLFGDDSAAGDRAHPLRSLRAARDKARLLRSDATDRRTPLVVLLRGGTYQLDETFVLESADSGTAPSPLVWRAYPAEEPLLSGGATISGWSRSAEGAWQVSLPATETGWAPTQLWVNGARRHRPRLPKKGFNWITFRVPGADGVDSQFGYDGSALDPGWHRLGDVELLIWHHWTISRMRVDHIDPASRVVTLTGKGRCANAYCQFLPGYRYLVENVREALSDPGEWYLDQGSGLLTYLPMAGEELQSATAVLPRLRQVLRVAGSEAAPVRYIRFEGLHFAHSYFPTPPEGYASHQAESDLEAAIEVANAEQLTFERCTVAHTAAYGIALRGRSHRNRIEGCVLEDLGAGGIRIGTEATTTDELAVSSANVVRDNLLIAGGRMHPAGVGVLIQNAANTLVEHNDIADFYYSGISVGWRWDYGLSNAHHNEVAYNRVQTIGQHVLSDMAGVYTLGVSPGTRIHHNVFSKIRRVRYGGWGIYPDQASSGIRFDHNLVYDTQDAPFHLHFGENLTLDQNVLIDDSGAGILRRSKAEAGRFSVNVHNNVMVSHSGKALTYLWQDGQYAFDNNLYDRAPLDYAGRDFSTWQSEGQDTHSVQGDPAFIDPATRNYQFPPASAAATLGIDAPALRTAGRLHPPYAKDRPQAPRAFPEALGGAPIAVDFEQMTLGQPPTIGEVHDGGSATSLVVSDLSAAAGGQRSLRFQDADNLDYAFNPHYVLKTDIADGRYRLQFWLRWESAAEITIEWRDWSSQPYRSGPLLSVDASGQLSVAAQSLAALPAGKWVRFEIAPLGQDSCSLG